MNLTPQSVKTWWWLYALAAVSLLTTLTLPYVGEEGVYTITSLEMKLNHDFFGTTLYGNGYPRPGLLSWLVIGLAQVLGWGHVLLASRLIAAVATAATGLVLAWLAFEVTGNRLLAACSAVVFLSGDVLFYRGWLAYSEPLFTFFVAAGIAALWVAALRQRAALAWLAVALVTAGFLTKVQVAYLFYAVAFAVLCFNRDLRRFLLGRGSILAHAAGVVFFLAWSLYFTPGTQASGTATDVVLKLKSVELGDYLRQLWSFPIETVLRFLPASAVAIYFAWRTRLPRPDDPDLEAFPWRTLSAILIINYLPYWIGPKTNIRYIEPLYPLASFLIAALIWRCGERARTIALRALIAAIALKYVVGLWGFPWYEHTYRGDYAGTARKIEAATRGQPLYVTDVSATGLSVTAELDQARYPGPYLRWPPAQWDDGFVLAYTPDPALGRVAASYPLGGNTLYLLCRGKACEARP
jgi:4-amino-4-deoxy-L-arabinose transferase-like glycosyltransferase